MFKIVKYCKKKFNIVYNCPTIQLGTLQYYRELDPNFSIADANEGIGRIGVQDYDPNKSSDEVKNLLGKYAPIHMHTCAIQTTFENCLIYCASIDEGKNYFDKAKSFNAEYDSYYFICLCTLLRCINGIY